MGRGPWRLVVAGAVLGLALAWALYWTTRFFESRRIAEAAMDKFQALLARDYFSRAYEAQVADALEQSHRALGFALGGPFLVAVGYLLWLFLWVARREE